MVRGTHDGRTPRERLILQHEQTLDPRTRQEDERMLAKTPLDGALTGWTAVVEFRLHKGRVVVSGVDLRPDDPPLWYSLPAGRALRRLNLGHVLDTVREILEQPMWATTSPAWVAAFNRGRRTGARGTSMLTYAQWAQRRVEAQEVDPTRPIKWLVERYGESERAINAFVWRARDKGLLTDRPPRLTPLAETILGGGDDGEH
jgi:hypothetical protein